MELDIGTTNKRYRAYFQNEYERVSGFDPAPDRTVINVQIVKSLPAPQDGDRRFQLTFKKLFHYEYLIRNLEGSKVEIYFKDAFSGKAYAKNVTLFLQAQVLEPVIYYKFLEHNILFMHAAGVSDGAQGFIFPAYGGTGKTTLTLGLMGEGMQVLGDDLLIVEPERQLVYPYLRPLHIFTYNVKTLREATIPASVKAAVKAKDILRVILEKVTRQEFLISTRVHAEVLYRNFQSSPTVPYVGIYFLKKTGEHEDISITKESIPDLARQILESEDLNDSLYQNILRADERGVVEKRELEVISNVLEKVDELNFVNTRLLDFRDLAEFKQRLVAVRGE